MRIKNQFRIITNGLWLLQWLLMATAVFSVVKIFIDDWFVFLLFGFLSFVFSVACYHFRVEYIRSFSHSFFDVNDLSQFNRRTRRSIIRALKKVDLDEIQ